MKTNTGSKPWLAILTGILLIILAFIVTSASPKGENITAPVSADIASLTSVPAETASVSPVEEPPYSDILDELAKSGPAMVR